MGLTAYACARCGKKPREGDLFLCDECYMDPQRMVEVRAAQAGQPDDGKAQRQLLIDMAGWAGWHRRIAGSK